MPIAVSKPGALRSKLAVAIVAAVALLAFAPTANAVTYSTSGVNIDASGGPANYGFGGTLHTQYDALIVDTISGSLVPNSTIRLNSLMFVAGFNALVPAGYHYSFSETLSIGGAAPQTLSVPFDIYMDSGHRLVVPGGQTLSFMVGASLWTLVVNGLTLGPNYGSPQFGYLTAQVTETAATPLPAAILLFGSGLGAMGLISRRRKAKAAAAAAA